jgi:glycosyltransferase involved in cell wall biosynthesis
LNVLIINQFASTPRYNTGAGERHFYIGMKLAEKGYHFTVISGSVNHLFITNPEATKLFNLESFPGGQFIWIRLRKYKSESFLGRSISWFEFILKLFLMPKTKYPRPDIVIASSMSLWTSLYAIYIKRKFRIPFVLEIRDIWPLTPIEIGGFSESNLFIKGFKTLEAYAYRKADAIISLMPDFQKHLFNIIANPKPVYWIPNAIEKTLLNRTFLERSSIKEKPFIVAYAGALGYANAMESFILAATRLNNYNIEFLIIGNGPEKSKLQILAANYPKIRFIEKMTKDKVLNLLSTVDVGYIGWRDLKIYDYGESANKYNDYMLAKLPIISSSNIINDPVTMASCGLQVPADDVEHISEAILRLYKMPYEDRLLLGENGYQYLIQNNTYDHISKLYEECIQETMNNFNKQEFSGVTLK